jgi:hypothetical protein
MNSRYLQTKRAYTSMNLTYIKEGKFLGNRTLALSLWFGLSLFAVLQVAWLDKLNIFNVFRSGYFHLLQERNLYLLYPAEYGDVYIYGPVFGLLIAPFALLPVKIGAVCWVMFNVTILYWAISKLPIARFYQTALLILCSHELMNSSSWLQANAITCAFILLGYAFVREKKDHWALFFIMLATFIKIYGIIGLAFFPFSYTRLKFILWALIWSIVFFIAPVLLTSWHFLLQTYHDWYVALSQKNNTNIRLDTHYYFHDISFMGLIRRIFYPGLKNIYVMLPAALFFISQFRFMKYFHDLRYQLYLLCSCLLFVVIFSTSAESPTYIIAIPAICIWYFLQPASRTTTIFFIILFVFTTFSYSDLLTPWFRKHVVMPYSLKALPSCIVWCMIVVQVNRTQFLRSINLAVAPGSKRASEHDLQHGLV